MDDIETLFLDTREASARLGVSVRALYYLISEGQLPAYKVGRDLRLRTDEVDAFKRLSAP